MIAGGLLAWIVFIPMISFFGAGTTQTLFPADQPISKLDAWGFGVDISTTLVRVQWPLPV